MKIRYWGKKLNTLFQAWNSGGEHLLCVTGDIDNLGVYVATHGRAQAENLVEIINHILGHLLEIQFKDKRTVYIPSGEEIIFMSLGGEAELKKLVAYFKKKKKDSFNTKLREELLAHSYPEYLGISFGVKVLKKEYFSDSIRSFLAAKHLKEKNQAYLSLMLEIRDCLTNELDKQKFFDILEHNTSLNEIYLRNLVYQEMLNYKQVTKQKILKEKLIFNPERKSTIYGVSLEGTF